jgi:hypothetical protein
MVRSIVLTFLTFILSTGFKRNTDIHVSAFDFTPVNSPLADGDIYKVSTTEPGLYKLDYNFIRNELGFSNIDNIDPKNIQIWSTGGVMLNETVTPGCEAGLLESDIQVEGEADGKFDTKDFILFYSQGPDLRYWNEQDGMYVVKKNLYSRAANYYIKFATTKGKRVSAIPFQAIQFKDSLSQYIDVQHLEDEKTNLLAGRTVTYGSGKQWYGDYFKSIRKKDYSTAFNFTGMASGNSAAIKIAFAARSDQFTDAILSLNAAKFRLNLNPTNTSDVEASIATETQQVFRFNPEVNQNVILDFPNTTSPSEGWLNYITLNVWKNLMWTNAPILASIPLPNDKALQIKVNTSAPTVEIWDVTNLTKPVAIASKYQNGQTVFYRLAGSASEHYMVFDKSGIVPSPVKGPKLVNQNLAGIKGVEAIILYYQDLSSNNKIDFDGAAKKLALHRNSFSNISTIAIPVQQVYNEFGAGQPDPTAIRNFAREQYLNNPNFKYLALFGDGSYDYLGHNTDLKNENFVPVYETDESLDPISSYPSDDYFGLLEEGEGGSELTGNLDIAIGRIPVRTTDEANTLTNKIIQYDLNKSESEDWKLRIAFGADDEDSNTHLDQSESLANSVESNHPEFNIQKIYLDAFKQESGAGGEIIPGATQSLSQNIFQGLLVFNYLGHGGPKGLSQEGLLRNSDVESWANIKRLPLVITATCSFAPYDDPNVLSTGEALFRSPSGGAIALFTTVRNVYSSANAALTGSVFKYIFSKDSSGMPIPLGVIMQNAKNSIEGFNLSNARKFALIGDPMQHLSIPKLKVATTQINARLVKPNQYDTIKSLQLLSIKGQVVNSKQVLQSGFNGNIHVTLYDKKSVVKTLGQNSNSYVAPFQIRNSILFKGNAVVKNGLFELSFIIPKDIDYVYGPSKISYFANSTDSVEAEGDYENVIIGGSQANINDTKGPEIKLYINDFQFHDGGETHPNPLLLVSLNDENGINATGNSIGHDLVATLDDDKQFVLNSFYESKQGDYRIGLIQYPFSKLTPGLHHIKVKAWDIANNSSEAMISFIVIDVDKTSKIISLTAFPNPAQNSVTVHLVHSIPSISLNAKIKYSISNVSGQIIDQVETILSPAAVTAFTYNFRPGSPAGVYFIVAEIRDERKRIDVQGVKVLRIP